MEWLDPALGAQALDRRVRALNPWPGTSLWLSLPGGETPRLKIRKAGFRADLSLPEGQIGERHGMVLLGTRAGVLELLAVQWDGKKEVDPAGFLNGLKGRGLSLPLGSTPPPVGERTVP